MIPVCVWWGNQIQTPGVVGVLNLLREVPNILQNEAELWLKSVLLCQSEVVDCIVVG